LEKIDKLCALIFKRNIQDIMGKHLIWISAFLALAFTGDRLVGFLLKTITKNSQFRYSRLYNSTESADILFVGNSRGLNFYQPEAERLTQAKTMNLSYNGMPADLAKTMVVDVTMCDRYNESLKSSMNLYAPYSERLATTIKKSVALKMLNEFPDSVQILDAYAGRKVYYGGLLSHLYRHNSEIFQRVLYHRTKPDNDWIVDRVIGESSVRDTSFKSYQVRMFPSMVAHLKEMVAYAQSKGVEVKLVINPYFPPFAETIRGSFLTPLKAYVEAETGLIVSDFSTALQNTDEIGDYQHANKKGSIHYMHVLAENGIFNTLTNNALGAQEATSPNLSLATPPTDSFQNFSNGTAPSVPQSPVAIAEPPMESATPKAPSTPKIAAAILPNENTSPQDSKFLIPITGTIAPKKMKKKRPRKDDYGFAVDTVGLGR
jgi:hypothetical protein